MEYRGLLNDPVVFTPPTAQVGRYRYVSGAARYPLAYYSSSLLSLSISSAIASKWEPSQYIRPQEGHRWNRSKRSLI